MSELRANPNTPDNVLMCFDMKLCGHNMILQYTDTQWRQITEFENGNIFTSEFVDYEIANTSESKVLFKTEVDGVLRETTYTILDQDNISYYVELDGFRWKEYLHRKH
ncbi:hypothetical protein [Teredinibacter sp. KSP-S5-2]|uniref:hypothetical protein n=1 Tax=Teredinibacter sp. KSP-S5-2 TaxID=3034506 RepID=UPI0029344423|nr:hypothetical protein [Teredinibacter sp. KSP-S5-2]WNO08663.1 hypothetical protein P5V12_16960 [Teredinibacter sp. KSP-S5-2]